MRAMQGQGRPSGGDTCCAVEDRKSQCVRKERVWLATLVQKMQPVFSVARHCAYRTETHFGPKIWGASSSAHPKE